MAKKKITRKSNRTLNLFVDGGDTNQALGQQLKTGVQNAFSKENLGGTIGAIGSGVSGIVGAGIQNAQINASGIEGQVNEAQAYRVGANNNDELMNEWSAYSPTENVSWRDIRGSNGGQQAASIIGGVGSGAASGASVGGGIGAAVGGAMGLIGGLAGLISGNRKAKKKAKELNQQIDEANKRNLATFQDRADSIDTQNYLTALSNFAAYGGKIHIKKENRGKFTDYCGGKVTSECIAKGKRSKNAAIRKRATFAANARKWHHDLGGYLYDEGGNLYTSVPNAGQHGGDFSNGVTIIGNGGTHEENPMEGVPMGVDSEGVPNLVEQGEVKFNDYVFSNRLFATDGLLATYNLPTTYADHSFADIAERLSKESSERPNDPISKKGLMSAMTRLQQAQEQLRMEKNKGNNRYAHGGKMGRKYDGEGNESNFLQFYTPQEKWLRSLQEQEIIPTYGISAPQKPYTMMTPRERMASYELEVPSLVDTRSPVERWVDRNIKSIQSNPSNPVTKDNDHSSSRQGGRLSWLRYAPAVGAGLGVISDLAGLTNKPDYTSADSIGEVADNLTNIEVNPIGNYLIYRPLDRDYYLNKLNAQAGATRRAIVDQSGGNRAAAMAGLIAADYNALGRMGDLARQAEEYNMAQRERVEAFNRGTNQFNAEMALKAATAKQRNDELRLKARVSQAQLRDQADARSSAGRSANLTNLFDSLGNIGIDAYNRADRDMLIKSGIFGTLSQKPQEWSNKRWEDYKKALTGTGYSKGGKLRKRRGGLTY